MFWQVGKHSGVSAAPTLARSSGAAHTETAQPDMGTARVAVSLCKNDSQALTGLCITVLIN